MQPLLILAIVGALAIAERAPSRPLGGAPFRLALVTAGVILVVGAASVIAQTFAARLQTRLELRGPGAAANGLFRQFRRWRAIHAVVWLGVSTVILCGVGWPQLVRGDWRLADAVLVDEVLILLPVLLPIVLSWAAWSAVDRVAVTAVGDRPNSTRASAALFHCRHDLALVLAPVLTVVLVQDMTAAFMPGTAGSPLAPLALLPILGLIILLLPEGLRRTWQTEPLPTGALRRRLIAESARCRASVRDVLVWHTGDRIVNAAVAGVMAPFRYIFLSDGLLARLPADEIEAIFAHELGHIRHRHLGFRLAALLVPVALLLLASHLSGGDAIDSTGWQAAKLHPALAPPMVLLVPVYMVLVFGRYSRMLERQADLFAVLGSDGNVSPRRLTSLARALRHVESVNGAGGRLACWLHPSVSTRIAFLLRMLDEPSARRRFSGNVRRTNGLLLGLLVAGVLAALY